MVLAASNRVKATRLRGIRAGNGATARHPASGAHPPAIGDNHRFGNAAAMYVANYESGIGKARHTVCFITYMVVAGSVYQSQARGGSEYLDHGLIAVDITIVIAINVEHISILPIASTIDTCTSIGAWT